MRAATALGDWERVGQRVARDAGRNGDARASAQQHPWRRLRPWCPYQTVVCVVFEQERRELTTLLQP